MNERPSNRRDSQELFVRKVGEKAARKLSARTDPTKVWFGLGMMGLVGWSVVVPTLLGAALGAWLDARQAGPRSWTLALLMAGLAIGCWNAWMWVSKEEKAMRNTPVDPDE
jgi:ATP synthase protein I